MIIVLAVAVAGLLLAAALTARHWIKRHGFWVLIWRWHSGHALDGTHRTNATWLKRSHGNRPVLHNSGSAIWWWHMPRLHRSGIRTGTEAALLLVLYGLWAAFTLTLVILSALTVLLLVATAWHLAYRVHTWNHERHYVKPLERTLVSKLPAAPLSIEVERVGDAVKSVEIEWPPETEIGELEKQQVLEAVTARLAIEAPEPQWQLKGRDRMVTLTHSDPPPGLYRWDRIAGDVASLAPDELLTGIGKKGQRVAVSLDDDSPHFGIAMGTGGGKSNLAAFWLVQELMRGSVALFLDAKYFSHPWAFKDMAAEYGQLPNIAYARRTPDMHSAMEWLGVELERRTEVAERGINAKGDVLGDVGPRIWIIAEEMNLAEGRLKQYWADVREKDDVKRSPALTGLGDVAFAGRAVKMNLIVIGQMLTAAALGGGAVRENIGVRCLARYTQNSWKMQAGDIPMPPSPSVPGRVQCLASGAVRETQVPLMDLEQVRELAVSGAVTPCPAGMPGAAPDRELVGTVVPPGHNSAGNSAISGSDLGLSIVTRPAVTAAAPPVVTLAEAVSEGIVGPTIQAVRKARSRDGDFPEPVGERPGAGMPALLYNVSDLYAWGRRRTDDRKSS